MDNAHPLPWTVDEVLKATEGEFLCGDRTRIFENVSIDSRSVSPHDVFVAIVGDVHDGHSFTNEVARKGSGALIVARNKIEDLPIADWQAQNMTCIAVDDTTRALGDLAAFHRLRAGIELVAITGSNGKTTTRQMTAAVMAERFNTLSTIGNYNNQIGVPLTLLRLAPEHQWAVVELGTNSPGEIARLAQICAPDIGLITNIGPAHLEGLESLDGVTREKEQLIDYLRSGGRVVLNADDQRVSSMAERTQKEVLFFGMANKAAVRATAVHEKSTGVSFSLNLPQERLTVDLKVPGQFMVINALAAAAVGHLLKLSAVEIKTGLQSFKPAWGRMNIFQTPDGIHIIDDTYNANPDSMKAAMTTLKTLCANNRSVIVAGDMLELGAHTEALHKQIGGWAAVAAINKLFVTGEFADAVVSGAMDAGMKQDDIHTATRDELLAALKDLLKPGDWVLVKGSRGARMDLIVEGLKEWAKIKPEA